jgi:DUF2909 family protein
MFAGYTAKIFSHSIDIKIMATLIFKIYIGILFLTIGASLIAGGFFLVKDDSKSKRLVTSLTFRISVSILLFVSLLVGFKLGWIQPHSAGF